jgi:hypothetical protein
MLLFEPVRIAGPLLGRYMTDDTARLSRWCRNQQPLTSGKMTDMSGLARRAS